ncbi:hypothetical protein EVAR_52460_1 [Eumeta japonica]|uniref:Uncharacterized protein n=1 Tax=Eumeta variegata TaxID=151549 RepID=A0A4C1YYK4_EUMVA|nr:hypothetical protein EVAR_52460_1 [Eumeta japonica]
MRLQFAHKAAPLYVVCDGTYDNRHASVRDESSPFVTHTGVSIALLPIDAGTPLQLDRWLKLERNYSLLASENTLSGRSSAVVGSDVPCTSVESLELKHLDPG